MRYSRQQCFGREVDAVADALGAGDFLPVRWRVRTGCCKAYNPSDPPPSHVAQTVTSDGRTMNYIVGREIGVSNRAVYDIHRSTPGWNGRLVYDFGGGCGAGYRQGTLGAVGMAQERYSQSYALATSTLNVFGNNCND